MGYPTGHYCCGWHVCEFYEHIKQSWVIANAYINTRHLKHDVYQEIYVLSFC